MSRIAVDWSSSRRTNYKEFCQNYPNIKITIDEWKNIIYTFNEEFKFHLLETGDKARLPCGFGNFAIEKKKRKQFKGKNNEFINLPIDWKKTKEKGKYIYNFNFETEGYFFGWRWFKPKVTFIQSDLWYFKPTRITSRLLAHYIRSDKKYMNLYQEWSLLSKT